MNTKRSISEYVDMGLDVATADQGSGMLAAVGAVLLGAAAVGVLTAGSDELWVWDARNNHFIGPYDAASAERLAYDLNQHVLQGTIPVLAQMGALANGPFYARDQRCKDWIERKV